MCFTPPTYSVPFPPSTLLLAMVPLPLACRRRQGSLAESDRERKRKGVEVGSHEGSVHPRNSDVFGQGLVAGRGT